MAWYSLKLWLSSLHLLCSPSSLIPSSRDFNLILYLFCLLLYILIISSHFIVFFFPILPLNFLLSLFVWCLFPLVIFFFPPRSAPWYNSCYEKKKKKKKMTRTISERPDVWTSAFICALIFGHTQNVPSCCTKPLTQSTNPCSACAEYIHA